jgi:hypothetical protein
MIHTGLGEYDQAFAYLDRAYAERAAWLVSIGVDPIFADLHGDPRFAPFLARIGLPPR